jgi:7-cyano-7-deazaguanine synthase
MGPATVLLSGGIDSAACAHFLLSNDYKVRAAFFNYGQPAALPEATSAVAIARALRVPLKQYSIAGGPCFQSGEIVGRNAFLVLGALLLGQNPSGFIALGIHAGTTYYDCSPAFVESLARLLAEHTSGKLRLLTPFLNWTKREVYDYYTSTGLPYDYAYSCESGSIPPCGCCASCRDQAALYAG